MGKTTNALEKVIEIYFSENKIDTEYLKTYHTAILNPLFENTSHPVYAKVNLLIHELESFLQRNKSPNYDYVYDQVISFGELISTTIISAYLEKNEIENTWLDARNLVKTDHTDETSIKNFLNS